MTNREEPGTHREGKTVKITATIFSILIGLAIATVIIKTIEVASGAEALQGNVQRPQQQERETSGSVHRGSVIRGKFDTAKLDVRLVDAWGTSKVLTFDVDTGFTGELCAPEHIIAQELGLSPVGVETYSMADGWNVQARVYRVTVIWHGEPRRVKICSGTTKMLLGMEMLRDSVLTLDSASGSLTVTRK